jgi:2-iminobutanoate/2-iminopropanoate deaminase
MTDRSAVRTDQAPAPFQGAPYSQAIRAGDYVFVSGQLPVAPGSHDVVGSAISEQTEQVLHNLGAILEAAGSSLEQIVKTTVYLSNLGDFEGMNEVYRRHIGDPPPARATIEVAALPSGALVEIEAIAVA